MRRHQSPAVEEIPLPDPRCGRTRDADLGTICLTEFRFDPDFHLGFHRHTTSALFVWLEGTLKVDLGRDAWLLSQPGEILAMPAGLPHREYAGPLGGRCFMIQGAESSLERAEIEEVVGSADGGVVGPHPDLSRDLERAFRVDLSLRERLRARARCLELVAGFEELHPGQGGYTTAPWVRKVERWLDEHYLDEWSLDGLGDRFGISPAHLARSFREAFGVTVGERIRDLRLEEAAEQLRRSDRPISDIATEAGFADQSHLTRAFKRRFGTTPARYRRAEVTG